MALYVLKLRAMVPAYWDGTFDAETDAEALVKAQEEARSIMHSNYAPDSVDESEAEAWRVLFLDRVNDPVDGHITRHTVAEDFAIDDAPPHNPETEVDHA